MPHVIVKLLPGRSEVQKARLTEKIVQDVIETLDANEDSVSVAFEEVMPPDWARQVFEPDIKAKWDTLTKKPGYTM